MNGLWLVHVYLYTAKLTIRVRIMLCLLPQVCWQLAVCCLNIDLARKRNPGLRGCIKRDGLTGWKLPSTCAWWVFQNTGWEKIHFSSANKLWKTVWRPWMQLSNIFATFTYSSWAFSQHAWSVFARLHRAVSPNDSMNKPLLTSTWLASLQENQSVA